MFKLLAYTMDLGQAFDLVEWASLFRILVAKCVKPIFLWVLLFIYRNQTCDVKWNSSYSFMFQVSNGVRQGAGSSPLLFSISIDDLLALLMQSGLVVDLTVSTMVSYAIQVTFCLQVWLASHVFNMWEVCKAQETEVQYKQSKTMCIIFSKVKNCQVNVAPVVLNEGGWVWVSTKMMTYVSA